MHRVRRLSVRRPSALYATAAAVDSNFRGFLNLVQAYVGDADFLEPALLKAYDEALPQINRALDESPAD